MSAVTLLAFNYLRAQRLVAYIFMAWALGLALIFMLLDSQDVSARQGLFTQQCAWVVPFAALTAGAAVHNERKHRAIIAILSKGIHRWEYVLGIYAGTLLMAAGALAVVGILHNILDLLAGTRANIWPTLLALWFGCAAASAFTLFLGMMMHPILTSILGLSIFGAGGGIASMFPVAGMWFSPTGYIASRLLDHSYEKGWSAGWDFVPAVLLHAVVLVWGANRIFRKIDVTKSLE